MHPWLAQMETLRARTAQPGVADPAILGRLSGLGFLQGIVRGEIPDPPITRTLDFYLLEVEPGRAVFLGLPGFAHYNPISTVHGGWHGTLLDSAMACAVQTLCEVGRAYTTLEFKIHCVRALTDKTGPVRAEGKVIASGRRMATAEGRLVDADGRLYSHGTTTCMLFDVEGPRG
ncbi:MAG: PaaI family thioesterase [Gemmatimonadota bacterium]